MYTRSEKRSISAGSTIYMKPTWNIDLTLFPALASDVYVVAGDGIEVAGTKAFIRIETSIFTVDYTTRSLTGKCIEPWVGGKV